MTTIEFVRKIVMPVAAVTGVIALATALFATTPGSPLQVTYVIIGSGLLALAAYIAGRTRS